jgi:transcriptional regulator with XRE-family HTH domain
MLAKRVRRGPLSMMTRQRQEAEPATVAQALSNARSNPGHEIQSAKSPTDAIALAASVGAQIRALRRSADMSTTELPRRASVSNGMLSKVERGTTMPSFVTITALARALNVPVARLFVGYDERRDCSIVRAGQGVHVDRRGSKHGHAYELLGHLLSGEIFVEPYLVTISQGASHHPSFQHTGVEFLYVVAGAMSYRYADRLIDIGPGDSLLFDATAVHGPEQITAWPVRYLSVVINLRA